MPLSQVAQQACHRMDLASAVTPACGDEFPLVWTSQAVVALASAVIDRMWPLPKMEEAVR
jgi:hypothetical protein